MEEHQFKNLVAPPHEQPRPVEEWIGHTSNKFPTNKKHYDIPRQNVNGPHPLFSMAGRRHFSEVDHEKPK